MKFRTVNLVEVRCPRCNRIHVARKENCKQSKKHPGEYHVRTLCMAEDCNKIWRWLHGGERYVKGIVIPDSYKHPIKRVVPDWSIY